MATIGQKQQNRTLFRGISSFWSRFFNDKDVINHVFTANDQLMGQIYLEMMEVLLANSIQTVPVFSRAFWKLLTFNSNDVEIIDSEYRYPLSDNIKEMPFIYNKIFEPSSILESGNEYRIEDEYIYFVKNIFDDLEYPGFAKRRDGNVTVISMWAPESKIDKEYVYEHYGRMLDIYEPSSESYKSFIQGIWFYYMNGPTINRITSAMNIIGGYPVASEDGEVVLSIKQVGDIYYVKTTATVYEIPTLVNLSINVGDTLNAFQHLTDAYLVTDYIDDPHWFDRIIVPIEVIPSLSAIERTTNVNDPSVIFIGYPIKIGQPGWKVGLGGFPNFMWHLFNGVLKYNIFYVTYNALASRFIRSTSDLTDIVLSGKPAFDLAMVVPYLNLQDTVEVPQEEGLEFELEKITTESYDIESMTEPLSVEIDKAFSFESYGKVPVPFGSLPTVIGSGKVGDPDLRLLTGVPQAVGTNTIGLWESGLYTEFPVEIFIL